MATITNGFAAMKTSKLLEDCIMFHKLTVFNCDAMEWHKAYMMGSLKKPHLMTIRNHMSHCKMMNGYIAKLPMLQDSLSAVTSTKKGNIPFKWPKNRKARGIDRKKLFN